MATITGTGLLLIRAGIMFLTFCAVADLWLASRSVLPENLAAGAIRGVIATVLFYLAWRFSMGLGKQGRLLKRAPGDKQFPSSSLSDQPENKPASAQGVGQHKDSESPEMLETDSSLAAVDDQLFAMLAIEVKTGKQDWGLWMKALAMADGDKSLHKRTEIYFRLRAERLHKEAEQERARLVRKRLHPYVKLAKQQKAKARALRRRAAAKRASILRRIRRVVIALVFTSPMIGLLVFMIYGFLSISIEQNSLHSSDVRTLHSRTRDIIAFLAIYGPVIFWLIATSYFAGWGYKPGRTRR